MPTTKVPKNAKRVFKGVIFDVYQWPQKMYDGRKKTFEVIRRQDTVVILPTIKDKIVVIKQKQPSMDWFYSLPSGRIDVAGESPKQTATRELLEETGLKAKKMVLLGKIQKTGKVIHYVYFFLAKDCVKIAKQKLDSGEKIKVMAVNFEQFLKLSDTSKFYESELTITMLRARLNPKLKQSLKKAIFN